MPASCGRVWLERVHPQSGRQELVSPRSFPVATHLWLSPPGTSPGSLDLQFGEDAQGTPKGRYLPASVRIALIQLSFFKEFLLLCPRWVVLLMTESSSGSRWTDLGPALMGSLTSYTHSRSLLQPRIRTLARALLALRTDWFWAPASFCGLYETSVSWLNAYYVLGDTASDLGDRGGVPTLPGMRKGANNVLGPS